MQKHNLIYETEKKHFTCKACHKKIHVRGHIIGDGRRALFSCPKCLKVAVGFNDSYLKPNKIVVINR
jgi:Zn finger protein HypA/HybF involved in hydrogenase expression